MSQTESLTQPDLFGSLVEPPRPELWTLIPEDVRDRKRRQLHDELARVQAATSFPWENLTEATSAEMSFNGKAKLLPPDECLRLRISFAEQVARHYNAIEEDWVPLHYAVPDR